MQKSLERALLSGPKTSKQLQAELGISQPTLSRLIIKNAAQVLTIGRARATRYALKRLNTQPIFHVDARGHISLMAMLHIIQGGYWIEYNNSPDRNQLYDGLPWFLTDMRPQGFLGQRFVQHCIDLGLPNSLRDWNDDHVILALAQRGEDAPGNLIIGEVACERWQRKRYEIDQIAWSQREQKYPQLAQAVLAGESPTSSAGGEQPKFLAMINRNGQSYAVLVKFSEAIDSSMGRRWADLLVSEHHALTVMRERQHLAAETNLVLAENRVFLEVTRFDRVGAFGRLGLISLGAIDDEFIGERRDWLSTAKRLHAIGYLNQSAVDAVAWQQAFAIFIGNNDRHFGNLSLQYDGEWPAQLAPAYDMLPMMDAPIRGELPGNPFQPLTPVYVDQALITDAKQAAMLFWQRVSTDERVSQSYRLEAAKRQEILEAMI